MATAAMGLRKHVVVIGGGFGGLACVKTLAKEPVRITLIDRSNHHLFQPLLYQVAMAGLAPADIAAPIRSVLRAQENVRVLLDEVVGIDLHARQVALRESAPLGYDYLVLACGAETSYFGNDGWKPHAPGLKDVDDAVEIRRRVLLAFEQAERETEDAARRTLLTFVVIGGGPTGVELAGAVAELAGFVLSRDFRNIHPDMTRVLLLEGGARILPTFPEPLSDKAALALKDLGVEVRTHAFVTGIDQEGVALKEERIATKTVLWAAGVRAASITQTLAVDTDRAGRVIVEQDCRIAGHPEAYCIGDAAKFVPEQAEVPLPGVSQTALQQGRFVARDIARQIAGTQTRARFEYWDKGSMATVGRKRAVAELLSPIRAQVSGFLAWLMWLFIHIWYLIDFRNRLVVLINWAWSYFTYRRGSRLITGHRMEAGAPTDPHGGR